MVKRKSPKAKTRKAARRPARRKTASGKVKMKDLSESPAQAVSKNLGIYWGVFRDLQKKIEQAWIKLRSDVRRKAPPNVILADRNHLMLLLGECNYMAAECKRIIHKK